jgi:hypothetical protein
MALRGSFPDMAFIADIEERQRGLRETTRFSRQVNRCLLQTIVRLVP